MFLSFYITDLSYALLFQHLLSYDSPSFKSLATKLQTEVTDSPHRQDWQKKNVGRNLQAFRYKSRSSKIVFWCLATRQLNPLEPMVFLEALETTLLHYFDKDQLTISKIINNQDRISLLISCMVDANEPAIMELNQLQEMVPSRGDLSKVINSTASSLSNRISQRDASQMFRISDLTGSLGTKDKLVPWRTAGLKYSNNELYVDVVETIHVILRKTEKSGQLVPVRGLIDGYVDFRSHLTGNPVVALKLNLHGHDLGVPALHPCCQAQYTGSPENLQFVPPDGKFRLMQYTIDLEALQTKSKLFSNMGLVSLDYFVGLGDLRDEFEIKVNIAGSQHVKLIDDLVVTIKFGKLTSDCRIKALRSTHGHFENGFENNIGKWSFDKETPTGTVPVFRGCLENATQEQIKTLSLAISYSNKGSLPSGIKVGAVDIISGLPKNTKPFKGVKYVARTGQFNLR